MRGGGRLPLLLLGMTTVACTMTNLLATCLTGSILGLAGTLELDTSERGPVLLGVKGGDIIGTVLGVAFEVSLLTTKTKLLIL